MLLFVLPFNAVLLGVTVFLVRARRYADDPLLDPLLGGVLGDVVGLGELEHHARDVPRLGGGFDEGGEGERTAGLLGNAAGLDEHRGLELGGGEALRVERIGAAKAEPDRVAGDAAATVAAAGPAATAFSGWRFK